MKSDECGSRGDVTLGEKYTLATGREHLPRQSYLVPFLTWIYSLHHLLVAFGRKNDLYHCLTFGSVRR